MAAQPRAGQQQSVHSFRRNQLGLIGVRSWGSSKVPNL